MAREAARAFIEAEQDVDFQRTAHQSLGSLVAGAEFDYDESDPNEVEVSFSEVYADVEWQDLGNCLGVDPDLFFPERGQSTREAKDVCMGCVVRIQCLDFALANNERHGVWGGLNERERRRERRRRAALSPEK